MVEKALGLKCLVDTFKIYDEKEWDEYNNRFIIKNILFVEMDGFSWDSSEYETLEDFLQSIIDHAHSVSMGEE